MSSDGISALERGHRRTPQRETLVLLAGALALDDKQLEEFETAASRPPIPRRGTSVTVGPWPDAASANLPLSLSSFVGRETEVAEMSALVREQRMVTLTGAGGVGKTQTALRVASALGDAEQRAVCFVGLAPLGDPFLVPSAIAAALGVQEVPNRPLLVTLVAHLKDKSLLLILDNCEHVILEAVAAVNALLLGCPQLRVLATSREPFNAAGEYAYRLPSLSIESATELFSVRARAVDHRFALTDDDTPIIAEICRRLDGIPLAIELAAASTRILSLTAVAEKLSDRFRLLAGGERTALPRQQTMRATIDWSYNLLAPAEQRVFERLSVFAGGCTFGAAAAVCASGDIAENDIHELMSSLVDKSLVIAEIASGEPRYRLLESFRQYAREKLEGRGEEWAVSARHARACLELARQFDGAFYYTDEVTAALAEFDNWRAALHWALAKRGDTALGMQLTAELVCLWQEFAQVEGWSRICGALELADERTPTEVLAALHYARACVAMTVGKANAMLDSSRAAIAYYDAVNDPLGAAKAQMREGQALWMLQRAAEGEQAMEAGVAAMRRTGSQWHLAWALVNWSEMLFEARDLKAARRCVEEALQLLNAMAAKVHIAIAMGNLGQIECGEGNTGSGLRHLQDALESVREFKRPRSIANALWHLEDALVSLRRYGEAETVARELLALGREYDLELYRLAALSFIAELLTHQPSQADDGQPTGYERSARILGFERARRVEAGSQFDADKLLAVLRAALGAAGLEELMRDGSRMSWEEVEIVALGAT